MQFKTPHSLLVSLIGTLGRRQQWYSGSGSGRVAPDGGGRRHRGGTPAGNDPPAPEQSNFTPIFVTPQQLLLTGLTVRLSATTLCPTMAPCGAVCPAIAPWHGLGGV